jgi:hypothetical protein
MSEVRYPAHASRFLLVSGTGLRLSVESVADAWGVRRSLDDFAFFNASAVGGDEPGW